MNKNYFLAAIALILFSSCSSNSDDSEQIQSSEIVGKWFYISETFDNEENVITECDGDQYYEFFSDNTIEVKELDQPPCEFELYNSEYTVSGETLKILTQLEGLEEHFTFKIIDISESRLILENSNNNTGEYSIYRLTLGKE